MHLTLKIAIAMFLVSSVVPSDGSIHYGVHKYKFKHLPWLRVGRATHNTWKSPFNDVYLGYGSISEKSRMYPFKRVGRSDLSLLRSETMHTDQNLPKRVRRMEDSFGMRFDPRLGRSFKSEEDEITIQTNNNDHSNPELMEAIHEDRVKRKAKTT